MPSYSPAIDRMMNSVRDRLPGALDAAIQRELFNAVDEFLKVSTAWREMIPVQAVANTLQYDLATDETSIIDQLIGVYDVTSLTIIPSTEDNWQVTAAMQGAPVSAVMPVPGTLLLQYAPSAARTYNAIVSCTCSDPTTRDGYPLVPTWICDKHAANDWLDGVLGKMLSQPAKPYSNQQMAVYHMRRFRNATAKAKVLANHNNVYRGQTWRFPQGFAVRHRR